MKRTLQIVITLLTCTYIAQAQTDKISMGSGYSHQAYYSLATGEVTTVANEAWDIAFSALGQRDAGILINESASYGKQGVQVYLAPSSDWTKKIEDTSIFVDSVALGNSEKNWAQGAFNSVRDESMVLDYGWGMYNFSEHKIVGNKVFVIKKRDGTFIKFQITELSKSEYYFRHADLDGSNAWTTYVSKKDAHHGLICYSFDSKKTMTVPAQYDLIFKRYNTSVKLGEVTLPSYPVTGVLLAPNVEAVTATDIDPNTIRYEDYDDKLTTQPDIIGHSWKSYNMGTGWSVDKKRTHFIKKANGDIYQLTFTDFSGTATGVTTVDKKLISKVSSVDEDTKKSLAIYPNPADGYITVRADYDQALTLDIYNIGGALVQSITCRTNTQIPTENLTAGTYTLVIKTGDVMKTQILIVQ